VDLDALATGAGHDGGRRQRGRVLASDVMTEIDFAVGTIDQVVERQRKGNVA
jgi:hypothetical protein